MNILGDGLLGWDAIPEHSEGQGQSYVSLNLTGGEPALHAALA